MTGIDTNSQLGPDATLFMTGDGQVLSARMVKAALDAYQVYLDEPLHLVGHRKGTITAREVVAWLRAGCPSEDLVYLVRHDRPTSPAMPHSLANQAQPTPGAPQPALEHPAEPILPSKQDLEAEPTLRDRLRELVMNPIAWVWAWIVYCGLGFSARMFFQGNPELTTWEVASAAALALLGSAALIFGALFSAGAMMGRGSSDLWNTFVIGVVGLATVLLASDAYGDAYEHLHSNQLAPLSTLVEKCMDDGVRYESNRIGAVCRDGWRSGAVGRGACSQHHGVAYWIYPRTQTRTVQQCRQVASDTSWLYYYSDTSR